MKKYLLMLIIAMGLNACTSQPYKLTANDIQYIQDPRSGLCFAVVNAHSHHQQLGMTTVDCNNVEGLLNVNAATHIHRQSEELAEELRAGKNFYNTTPSFSSF